MNRSISQTLSIVFLCSLLTACHKAKQTNPAVFDQTKWLQAQPGPGISVRMPMIGDLLNQHKVKKLSRSEIRRLLGKPMPYETTPENEDWYLVQELFHGPGTGRWEEPYLQAHLVFKYSSKSQVVREVGISRTEDTPGQEKKMRDTFQIL